MGRVEQLTDGIAQLSRGREGGGLPPTRKAWALEGPEPLRRCRVREEIGLGIHDRDHGVGEVYRQRLPAHGEAGRLSVFEAWCGCGCG
jgi:hypothetical protein